MNDVCCELKPCPFCGGMAELNTWRNEHFDTDPAFVVCLVCGAKTHTFENPKSAVSAWNIREE